MVMHIYLKQPVHVGQAAQEIVWKATAWNMPLAVAAGAGCGTDGDLAEIARRYNVLFYFWAPDAMLSELEPACRLSAFIVRYSACVVLSFCPCNFFKHRVWKLSPRLCARFLNIIL